MQLQKANTKTHQTKNTVDPKTNNNYIMKNPKEKLKKNDLIC